MQFSQWPSTALSNFPKSNRLCEISSLSKVILVLEKTTSHRVSNLGCRRAESPGWFFDLWPKSSAQDAVYEQVRCYDEAASHQLPIAAAFWIIWVVSTEDCWSLMQNLMQIHCSPQSFLNMTGSWYSCSLKGISRPRRVVQWTLIVHTCTFQSTLLGCQVKLMSYKLFLVMFL